MAEYIEREAFIAHIRKEVKGLHTKMPMDLVIEGVANEAKAFPAADVVPGSDFRDCRNELCLRCGQYKTAHLGSCDGCRWRH